MRGVGVLVASVLLLLARPSEAHDPRLVSLRLYDTDEGASIEVVVPTAGIEMAFDGLYETQPTLDSEEGQERIIAYLRERLVVSSAGGVWVLGGGGIRVGGHETVVVLSITPPDEDHLPVHVHAPLFAENEGARVTLHYVTAADDVRVVLTAENAFEGRVVPSDVVAGPNAEPPSSERAATP
jgi:hypothetical protein